MPKVPLFFVSGKDRSDDAVASEIARALVDMVNQERARRGLPPMPKGDAPEAKETVEPDPRYPRPDRSEFVPNKHVNDEVAREGDLFARDHVLPDGRPCRVEGWWCEGLTLVTLFFSTLDMIDAQPAELSKLIAPVLDAERVPAEKRSLSSDEVHVIQDASGNPMYSLTFTVGVPD